MFWGIVLHLRMEPLFPCINPKQNIGQPALYRVSNVSFEECTPACGQYVTF